MSPEASAPIHFRQIPRAVGCQQVGHQAGSLPEDWIVFQYQANRLPEEYPQHPPRQKPVAQARLKFCAIDMSRRDGFIQLRGDVMACRRTLPACARRPHHLEERLPSTKCFNSHELFSITMRLEKQNGLTCFGPRLPKTR